MSDILWNSLHAVSYSESSELLIDKVLCMYFLYLYGHCNRKMFVIKYIHSRFGEKIWYGQYRALTISIL